MAEDLDSVSFLGEFALESVLQDLGEGSGSVAQVLGGGSQAARGGLGKADIYNDNYDNDEDFELSEEEEQPRQPTQSAMSTANKYQQAGLAFLQRSQQQHHPMLALPSAPSSSVASTTTSSPALAVKQELPDDAGLPPPSLQVSLPHSAGSSITSTAPATALETASREPALPKPRTIHDVFPDFSQDQILDFVAMFSKGASALHVATSESVKASQEKQQQGAKRPGWDLTDATPPSPAIEPEYTLTSQDLPSTSTHSDSSFYGPNLASFLPPLDPSAYDTQMGNSTGGPPMSSSMDDDAAERYGKDKARSFDMILLSDWESRVIYDADRPPSPKRARPNALTPYNVELEKEDWIRAIAWDGTKRADFSQLTEIEEEDENAAERLAAEAGQQADKTMFGSKKEIADLDMYNISNDHHYEGGKHRVRQTFGTINVQHAYPALKLQLPFYKTFLNKSEARSWHRPALQFPANVKISFERVRTAKKLKDKVGRKLGKGGDVAEGLRKPSDLSLRDTSSFVLWEFSEEHPPIMSSFGMGSVLVNYYRKTDDNDEFVPKLELGEPRVIDPQDEPPISTFVPLDHGQTQPTLYNNLIKAPLFRQNAAPTDFLVVRSTVKGESHYYIREIKSLFVVGQTIPQVVIQGPHARKISATAKARTHLISYKLLQKAKHNRIQLKQLMKYFGDTHELQMRQRLKDFLEFHRKGPHQQTWRLKAGLKFPDPDEYLKIVTPEDVMMVESMQVGQRVLEDAGYSSVTSKPGKTAKDDDEDEANMSTEQLLAPWVITKSYLQSQRDKAWVQLYGEGDPTGRGEGFSFIKVSMKEIFLRQGETAEERAAFVASLPKNQQKQGHAVQEAVFRSEARRIWDAQQGALSNPISPTLSDDEWEDEDDGRAGAGPSSSSLRGGRSPSRSSMMRDRSPSAVSRSSSIDRDDTMSLGSSRGGIGGGGGAAGQGGVIKVMKIKRLIKGEWVDEIIRDINVINTYIRKRQIIEQGETDIETVAPTGDADRDKMAQRRLQEEIEKLKKNQTRRLNRKKTTDEHGNAKQIVSRRCANCGQTGHMKTNRKCPRWAEFNLAPTGPPTAHTAGLPLGLFHPEPGPSSSADAQDQSSPAPQAAGESGPKLKFSLKR